MKRTFEKSTSHVVHYEVNNSFEQKYFIFDKQSYSISANSNFARPNNIIIFNCNVLTHTLRRNSYLNVDIFTFSFQTEKEEVIFASINRQLVTSNI